MTQILFALIHCTLYIPFSRPTKVSSWRERRCEPRNAREKNSERSCSEVKGPADSEIGRQVCTRDLRVYFCLKKKKNTQKNTREREESENAIFIKFINQKQYWTFKANVCVVSKYIVPGSVRRARLGEFIKISSVKARKMKARKMKTGKKTSSSFDFILKSRKNK